MSGNATLGMNGAIAQDKLGNFWYTSPQNALVKNDGKEFKAMLSSFNDTGISGITKTTCMRFDIRTRVMLFY